MPFWKTHKPHRETVKESKTTSAESQERCQAEQQQQLDKSWTKEQPLWRTVSNQQLRDAVDRG